MPLANRLGAAVEVGAGRPSSSLFLEPEMYKHCASAGRKTYREHVFIGTPIERVRTAWVTPEYQSRLSDGLKHIYRSSTRCAPATRF